MQRAWDDHTHDADWADWDDNELVSVVNAATQVIKFSDPMMAKIVNTYVTQLKLGESIYDYPEGGWMYGS